MLMTTWKVQCRMDCCIPIPLNRFAVSFTQTTWRSFILFAMILWYF